MKAKEIEAVVARFPQHELAVRRLHARDPTFRSICEDYGEALRALRFWEAAEEPVSQSRVRQYRELVGELEDEIAKFLAGPEGPASG